MNKHTPGPWMVDENYLYNIYSDDCTGSIVATAGKFSHAPRPHEEKEANARLIAAAPDMLEALEELSRNATNVDAGGGDAVLIPCKVLETAQEAIRKAKGE